MCDLLLLIVDVHRQVRFPTAWRPVAGHGVRCAMATATHAYRSAIVQPVSIECASDTTFVRAVHVGDRPTWEDEHACMIVIMVQPVLDLFSHTHDSVWQSLRHCPSLLK